MEPVALQVVRMKRNCNRNPITIRLDDQAKFRLARLSARLNLGQSDLVRAAVAAKLPEWELNGLKLETEEK